MSNVVWLDSLDRKILHQLDVHARQSSAAIARTLETPEETIRYRMRNLASRGTIVSTLTIIDAGLLGNNYFKILIKLQNPRMDVLERLERFLLAAEAVNWVARCETLYDIAFTIRVHQLAELNAFIDVLKQKFHAALKDIVFAVNVEVDFLPRDYLINKERPQRRKSAYTTPRKERALDSLDLTILRVLSKDARLPVRELAKQAHCSDETIADRLMRLEHDGVITGYRLVLDCARCGIANYYILLYLNYSNPRRTDELRAFIRAQSGVSYMIKAIGPWDFEINLEVFDTDSYRQFMGTLTAKFADLLGHWEAFPVTKVQKLTISP